MGTATGKALIVEARTTIKCTPEEFLELVMDVERYQLVDTKIYPVDWARRDGNVTEFKFRPKVAGIPSPKVVQRVTLTPGERIDILNAPTPMNRLAYFHGSFECLRTDGMTQVTRRMEFRINPVVRWLFKPLLRRALSRDLPQELKLAKDYLESQNAGTEKPADD
jgi:Polyketide cyclase / dehydrase and lipid transport